MTLPERRNRPAGNGPASDDHHGDGIEIQSSLLLPPMPPEVAEHLASMDLDELRRQVRVQVHRGRAERRAQQAVERIDSLIGTVPLDVLLDELRFEFTETADAIKSVIA